MGVAVDGETTVSRCARRCSGRPRNLRHHRVMWIDTHCHLDAPEFAADRADGGAARARRRRRALVLPAVQAADFDPVRELAQASAPPTPWASTRCTSTAPTTPTSTGCATALQAHRDDPRLVAVGEIGLDHFVPGLDRAAPAALLPGAAEARARRRPAGDPARAPLGRRAAARPAARSRAAGGIAHAFNGSEVQARQFVERGFALGFGGAMTFERALQIRALAAGLPETALVLETDAPDIPPQWLYRTAAERAARRGQPQRAGRAAAHRRRAGGAARLVASRTRRASPRPTRWPRCRGWRPCPGMTTATAVARGRRA